MSFFGSLKAFVTTRRRRVPKVSAKEAARLQKEAGATIVDVREAFEFKRAHIPGALHIPLGDVERRAAEIPKDRPVVLHCAMGSRSAAAAAILEKQGFPDVKDLSGGFVEWKREELPVEK